MNIHRLARILALPLLGAALLAAACGDGDDDSAPTATAPAASETAASATSSPVATAPAPSASAEPASAVDREYIATVCAAGATFVQELAPAANAYAQEIGSSQDPAVTGPAAQKHFTPVFTKFLEGMRAAQPPADASAYHAQIIDQLEAATERLENADPTAMQAILAGQLELPPAEVADRLNRVGAENEDCQVAGFFIGQA